ncbi:MAG TPA: type IV toxin-antitoxin system AbiEi family antitoxin domain-containing protein [Propioniciclava tarda]|nr:type IV toxin-antitoxin system AbiEi family antitoxin domain-containing protein [Propioniciclava tarda]
MIPSRFLTQGLGPLLHAQGRVVKREQALNHGISAEQLRRLLETGALRSVARGIYTDSPLDTWLLRAWTGVLLGGDQAVLGFASAAHLHQLWPEPKDVEVWVGRHAWPGPVDGFSFIRGVRRGVGVLARTRVEDTILDLAPRISGDEMCRLVADAIGSRRTSSQRIAQALRSRPRQPKRQLVQDMTDDVRAGVRSPLEHRYLTKVERAHGLPIGERQWSDGSGRLCDVRYKEGLLVELDGQRYHSGAVSFDDMNRDNDHVLTGVPTLRFGFPHGGPGACETARLVGQALARLGRVQPITTCPHCRRMPLG